MKVRRRKSFQDWEYRAFSQKKSAQEEKEAAINQAQAYQYRTVAIAQGEAEQNVLGAKGQAQDRTARAYGSAARFQAMAKAYGQAPDVTRLRLQLEAVEGSLAGRRKVIVDHTSNGSRRQLFLGPKGIWTLRDGTLAPGVPLPVSRYSGVQAITRFIEDRVRESPADWFWVHKRWPDRVYAALESSPAA